jgi:nitrile hydratase accessory protein
MPGEAALPRANGELVFEEPWEGRAFGVTVAMHQGDLYNWDEFRDRLIAAIADVERTGSDSSYYRKWLESTEALVVEKGLITKEELEIRAELFASDEYDDHVEH